MKKLTKIEPQPQVNDIKPTLEWLSEFNPTKSALGPWETQQVIIMLIHKVNELTDEVNRMNGFEAGTVKEIDHSPCNDKDPIQTLAAIRDKLLPLVDNTSECGDMLSCTGSRTECVQGLVDQIVDQYYNICNLIRNEEEWVYLSESIQSKVENVLSSIKKGGSDE